MKILMISPYVTINGRSEFESNKTGFGYMVHDIADAVGKIGKVDLLCTDSRGKGFVDDGVNYLSRDMLIYIKNVFASLSLVSVCKLWRQYKMHNSTLLRVVYYWLMTGYLNHLIKDEKYDIIHIHGCGFATELWMKVCKQCNQKYVVTLHGLNSFSDTVKLEPAGKRYERDFLKRVTEGEFLITVISTGMKRLIENTYRNVDCKNIMVVCNSHSFGCTDSAEVPGSSRNIREKYNIPQDAKILLYVGNISENKNQRQMVDTYEILPANIKNSTWVLFCGRPSIGGHFEDYVRSMSDSDHLILCGMVEKSEMSNYYNEAAGVVLLSHAEGFGLSLIEGLHFGIPCMMFKDMDAFEDIYDERAVVAVEERTNKDVAHGLEQLIIRNWNKGEIKESSTRFEAGTMAKSYIDIYREIIA